MFVCRKLTLSDVQKYLETRFADPSNAPTPPFMRCNMVVIWLGQTNRLTRIDLNNCKSAVVDGAGTEQVEDEFYLDVFLSTFDDYNEMVVQFGYLALFAPAFPLAPVLALLNNIIEIRIDAVELCHIFERPTWNQSENIGSWFAVLNVVGFFA